MRVSVWYQCGAEAESPIPKSEDRSRFAFDWITTRTHARRNKPAVPPDYYIVPGCDLRSDPGKFGKWFADYKKMPGIHPKDLAEYREGWQVFES
jgi:hypothetical protein